VIGGNLPAMITPLVSVLGQVQSGKLKVLATSDKERSPRAPNVPTFAELGHPQLSMIGWFGVFLPAGTAPEIVNKLNESIGNVLRKPAVAEKLAAVDSDARPVDPAVFARMVQSDTERWGRVVKETGFTSETQ
ncbi:MAG TPA: tripartite tricarboxylate transporter substrate-binding protein, partial [Ramlibacter sp.]